MSPSIPRDGDRLFDLAQEMGERLGGIVREVVPSDAANHLINAQRELLTALVLIYEHQAGGRRPATRRTSSSTRTRASEARSRRVNRIKVD